MYVPFEQMPPSARIWIYQSDRPFEEQEKTWIISKLVGFCNQWNTHGVSMPTSFEIKHNQFVIMAVDESKGGASGCSIDSSIRVLREIENELQLNLLDSGKISYFGKDKIKVAMFPEIKKHIQEGELQAESKVFNPSVNKKADLDKDWVVPANQSWLKRYFTA
ncbi:hypothetical protein [Negadavirga shengliensis]|uniref:ABC transporter ATPase n=1 Tax=Negadavirga shengliensis TaxID=1389218 RepID=A0ABV9T0U9_9BACT